MTAKDGMTALTAYRGIHAGVTKSGVKSTQLSAACRHVVKNENSNNKAGYEKNLKKLTYKVEFLKLFIN